MLQRRTVHHLTGEESVHDATADKVQPHRIQIPAVVLDFGYRLMPGRSKYLSSCLSLGTSSDAGFALRRVLLMCSLRPMWIENGRQAVDARRLSVVTLRDILESEHSEHGYELPTVVLLYIVPKSGFS